MAGVVRAVVTRINRAITIPAMLSAVIDPIIVSPLRPVPDSFICPQREYSGDKSVGLWVGSGAGLSLAPAERPFRAPDIGSDEGFEVLRNRHTGAV